MLVKIKFIPNKLFYKIKCQKLGEKITITAPMPKSKKQKAKLIKFLKPFAGKIIYPEDFNCSDYPAPYPAFEIKCRKMIADFLNLCKTTLPDVAVITPNGLIKDLFYFDLSEYVGKIVVKDKNENTELKSALLAHSGTVIEYTLEYNKNQNSIAVLTMPTKRNPSKM